MNKNSNYIHEYIMGNPFFSIDGHKRTMDKLLFSHYTCITRFSLHTITYSKKNNPNQTQEDDKEFRISLSLSLSDKVVKGAVF